MKHVPSHMRGRRSGPPMKKASGTLKPGQVVFFNGCKKTTGQKSEPFIFKGHGFGVFLGVVPPNIKEPGREHLDPLLAGIGWVSFENVFELLGEDNFKLLETKFRAKYGMEDVVPEGEKMPHAPAPKMEPEIAMPPEKQLVDVKGRPLFRDDPEEQTATPTTPEAPL